MSFIPSELQEDKRRAENALGRITLSHPDDAKAIGLYWGKLELHLLSVLLEPVNKILDKYDFHVIQLPDGTYELAHFYIAGWSRTATDAQDMLNKMLEIMESG